MNIVVLVVGYLASVLLAISLLVNNDLRFRWLNLFGCISFIIYGLLIHAYPIILTNSILLLINLVYLVKIYTRHEDFDLIEFKGGERLVIKFLSFYKEDIQSYFHQYEHKEDANNISFVVLRDIVIANIFIANLEHDGTAVVKLNYTVPKYRDYKVGRFIFDKNNTWLLSKGVKRLVYKDAVNKQHEAFIQVMGFKKEALEGGMFYTMHLA